MVDVTQISWVHFPAVLPITGYARSGCERSQLWKELPLFREQQAEEEEEEEHTENLNPFLLLPSALLKAGPAHRRGHAARGKSFFRLVCRQILIFDKEKSTRTRSPARKGKDDEDDNDDRGNIFSKVHPPPAPTPQPLYM